MAALAKKDFRINVEQRLSPEHSIRQWLFYPERTASGGRSG